MKKMILNPLGMLLMGTMLGILSRLLDIYTSNLGNIFSQMAIWILFGALISIYSPTKKQAMVNISLFCIGMLITYYWTAFMTHGFYSKRFILGWTIFAFFSPLFAYFTCLSKEKGLFPFFIRIGIVGVSFFSSILLFDRLRVYDFVINGILIYYLFFKRIDRASEKL